MDNSQLFGGNYMNAGNAPLHQVLTISEETVDTMKQDQRKKPVIKFEETQLGLILNKTNDGILAAKWGRGSWKGKKLKIEPVKVSYQGQIKDGLTVIPQD